MTSAFEKIDNPIALKQLSTGQLEDYAVWLRNFLIEGIAENGGHFAANLGTIELSIALHYLLETPLDKIVWDVGHQAYAHKILTGRKNEFQTIRKYKGLSGFPKMDESEFDAFGTGHSSTSVSAILGYAVAARLQGIKRQHIAVIGDGALSAGQAFEAMNNAGLSKTNITVIINDNNIGIDPSQGAFGEYLARIKEHSSNWFSELGFDFYGPVNGHDLTELLRVFKSAFSSEVPKVILLKTIKGKGYGPAESEQTKWHSTSQFDKLSGKNTASIDNKVRFQDVFGKTLLELAEKDKNIVAITPAMVSGSSLHFMQEKFPERVFDVGIAEQHAVTFSAGLAASGLIPFCCIYSTFLQRGYDQLIHDVALQNLPVIFAVDRAGLVGEDGPTHHGVFDIAFLQTIPNLTIISPRNQQELRNAMYTACIQKSGPYIIRYPRGKTNEEFFASDFKAFENGSGICLKTGTNVAVLSIGTIASHCEVAVNGTDAAHYDLRFVKPLDQELLNEVFEEFSHIIIVEESQKIGGLAAQISLNATERGYKGKIHSLAIADHFVTHADMGTLFRLEGLHSQNIRNLIQNCIS